MKHTFEMACTEVLEILKLLPQDEYIKIPKNEIEFLESKKDINYEYKIDRQLPLDQMNISRKANAILVVLWEKYFATEKQKQKLNIILKENYKKEEEKKKELYNYENLFKKNKVENKIEETAYMIPIKEIKWYERIYIFIKRIFKR